MLKIGNNSISNVRAGANQISKIYAGANLIWQNEPPVFTTEYIDWDGINDLTEISNSGLIINAAGSWNGKAYSSQQAGDYAKAEMTVPVNATNQTLFGLITAASAASAIFTSPEYLIFNFQGVIYTFESGTLFGTGFTTAPGDVLSVELDGDIIYRKNSTVIRSVEAEDVTIAAPVKVIAFLQETGSAGHSEVDECKITF